MKILREGTKPSAPWWVGLKLQCDCGCEVELEEGDYVGPNSGDFPGAFTRNRRDLYVTCPFCKKGIKFKSVSPYCPDPAPQWPTNPPITYTRKTQPCLHDSCPDCHGTGVKSTGGMCVHGISCPCPKCSPTCMSL